MSDCGEEIISKVENKLLFQEQLQARLDWGVKALLIYKSNQSTIDDLFNTEVKQYNDGNFLLAGVNLGTIDSHTYQALLPVDYRDDKVPGWFFSGVFFLPDD